MKKFLVVIAVFVFFTGTAFARLNPNGKVMLGANGDLGFTISGPDASNTESDIGKAYGAGLKAGYGISDKGIVYGGLELQQRELVVKYDYMGSTWKEHYTQKYIDIPVAFRLLFGHMYADFGGYYGIRVGDMKWKASDGESGSGTVDKSETKNDYGLLLAIGGVISTGENSGIDIGFKTKYGFANVLDSSSANIKVSGWSLMLTVGYITVL